VLVPIGRGRPILLRGRCLLVLHEHEPGAVPLHQQRRKVNSGDQFLSTIRREEVSKYSGLVRGRRVVEALSESEGDVRIRHAFRRVQEQPLPTVQRTRNGLAAGVGGHEHRVRMIQGRVAVEVPLFHRAGNLSPVGVEFLGDLHRSDLGGEGRARTTGEDDPGDERPELAERREQAGQTVELSAELNATRTQLGGLEAELAEARAQQDSLNAELKERDNAIVHHLAVDELLTFHIDDRVRPERAAPEDPDEDDPDAVAREQALNLAMESLQERFGEQAIQRGGANNQEDD